MGKLIIDCKKLNTKELLLKYLVTELEEMFSPNYDALIDCLQCIDENIAITILNIDNYNDKDNLVEVFKEICDYTNLVSIEYK